MAAPAAAGSLSVASGTGHASPLCFFCVAVGRAVLIGVVVQGIEGPMKPSVISQWYLILWAVALVIPCTIGWLSVCLPGGGARPRPSRLTELKIVQVHRSAAVLLRYSM